MVDVPSVTAKPTNLPAPQAARQTAQGASPAAFGGQLGAATGTMGDAFSRVGAQAADAAIKLQEQQNARDIMKRYNQYQTSAAGLYRDTIQTQDLLDPAVGQNYNAQLTQMRAELMAETEANGPIASAQLDKLLSETNSGFSMKLVTDTQAAYEADADRIDQEETNRLYQAASDNPHLLNELRDQAEVVYAAANMGSTPQRGLARAKMYEGGILEGALDGLLSRGAWQQVAKILDENPDAANILGPESFKRIINKMYKLESGVDKDSTTIINDLTEDQHSALVTDLGEGVAAIGRRVMDKAANAQQTLISLGVQRQMLEGEDLRPGFMNPPRRLASKAAALFGIDDPEILEMFMLGNSAASDVFQSEANQQVAIMAQEGSQRTTLFIQTVMDSVPQLTMTEDGIDAMITLREWVAKTTIEEGKIWRDYAFSSQSADPDSTIDLGAQLDQFQVRKEREFEVLKKVIEKIVSREDQPKTWREAGERAAQDTAEGQSEEQQRAAENAAKFSEENHTEMKAMIGARFEGYEYVGVGANGAIVVRDATDPEQVFETGISAEEFLGMAGDVAAPGEEETDGSEAPAEDPNADPF